MNGAGLNLQLRGNRTISLKARKTKRANWPYFNLEERRHGFLWLFRTQNVLGSLSEVYMTHSSQRKG